MNFPFYIARRYLFAKKSHNVINVISAISVAGIILASFALICTLSVFNGFHELVESLFRDFDPELKVVSTDKKFFSTEDSRIQQVCKLDFIDVFTFTLEEQALISYKSKQQIAMIKGVDDNYHDLVGIENLLKGNGIYMLEDAVCHYGIMGVGLMNKMNSGIKPSSPLKLYVPKKEGRVNMSNPISAFNYANIYSPGVIFCVCDGTGIPGSGPSPPAEGCVQGLQDGEIHFIPLPDIHPADSMLQHHRFTHHAHG